MMAGLLACEEDGIKPNIDSNSTPPPSSLIKANFENSIVNLKENDGALTVRIQLSSEAEQDYTLVLNLEEAIGQGLFSTLPSLNQNEMELVISAGQTVAEFSVIPQDNNVLSGHKSIKFNIVDGTTAVAGDLDSIEITILDDELFGKAQSYESAAGGWKTKRTFVYDQQGRVSKINWTSETPGASAGTDTYYYDANGMIEKINYYPDQDEYFISENGRIIRSEKIEYGVKKSYSEYDYDFMGNVAGRADYYLQSNGSYVLSLMFVYLYFQDGNLYKQLAYYPAQNGDLKLTSTRTYDHYYDKVNPFPVNEIIPTISSQTKLPGSYRIEENDVDLFYQFSYEFNANGEVTKRTTNSESTLYLYY
ncbi:hypothetical protein AWN68_15480 [Roseivirga echinicomitans]|uniref:DUF4595 domain-containing protein n=1 Tax=Roseivirga echinicomitans TaxID=296218 RepID=A0A150XUF1_9BACT|nr:hypothetical protein AWN68_15480 [Roseivirga echinicomitans]